MAYTVLSNPAGTLGYKPSKKSPIEEIFAPMAQGFGDKFGKSLSGQISRNIYSKAAEKEGLAPQYEIDAEGGVKTTYTKPKEEKGMSLKDVKERTKALLAGIGLPEDYGFQTRQEMDEAKNSLREEISADKHLKEYFGIKDEKDEKPNFDRDIESVIEGQLSWDDLRKKWGSEVDTIEKLKPYHTPIEKDPEFKEGKGLAAWKSPKIANINESTKYALNQIKTEKDYNDLMADYNKNPKQFKEAGVDVKAIMEYFGRR
jgi:hypothetical protein